MYGCTARDVHARGGEFSRKELGILEDYIPLVVTQELLQKNSQDEYADLSVNGKAGTLRKETETKHPRLKI